LRALRLCALCVINSGKLRRRRLRVVGTKALIYHSPVPAAQLFPILTQRRKARKERQGKKEEKKKIVVRHKLVFLI
jgi:hypothetical protein